MLFELSSCGRISFYITICCWVVLWQNARLEPQCFVVITFLIIVGAHVVLASPIGWTSLGRFGHFCLINYC